MAGGRWLNAGQTEICTLTHTVVRIRLDYNWNELWALKVLLSADKILVKCTQCRIWRIVLRYEWVTDRLPENALSWFKELRLSESNCTWENCVSRLTELRANGISNSVLFYHLLNINSKIFIFQYIEYVKNRRRRNLLWKKNNPVDCIKMC